MFNAESRRDETNTRLRNFANTQKNWAFECFNFHPEMLHVHFRMEIGEIQLLMLPSYIIFSLLALGPIPVIVFARFYLFISSRR